MDNKEFKIKEVNINTAPAQITLKQNEVKPGVKPGAKPGDKPQKPKTRGLINLFRKKNLPKTLAVIILIVGSAVVLSFVVRKGGFDPDKVTLSISAPSAISSGEETTLKINYMNDNRVDLKDVYLIIDYPSNTFSSDGKEIYQERKNLSTISQKSRGTEEFKVRFVGEKGDAKTITAKLGYQPQNMSSRFEPSVNQRIEINSVSVSINVDGSQKAISGQDANYLITFENKTEEDIHDLKLELFYDKDFKFKNADPAPQDQTNNLWQISILKKGEKRSINLIGTLSGNEGESKSLKVIVGRIENDVFIQYSQLEYLTLIAPSPLLLNLTLEDAAEDCNVNPGQVLKYIIGFENNADVPLRELILKAYLKDSVFNVRNIQLNGVGFFDSRENTITWSGGDIPALKLLDSHQSGDVSFSVSLKRPIPMSNYNDKNLLTKVSAEIGTKTVPAKFAVPELKITRDLSCKINSVVDLKTRGYYYESNPKFTNSGPVPPRVNALTTYTIHWQIVNGSNDLNDVRVNSGLPEGIEWMNNYINNVPNSTFDYDTRTKELVWIIPRVPAGVGYVLPVYEVIAQVGLRPSINQIGTVPELIKASFLSGRDSFTGVVLSDSTSSVNTSLPDDPRNPSGVVKE